MTRVLLSAVLGAAVVIASAAQSARAEDDEDEDAPADVKFFRNILSGLGLKRDGSAITYQERAPLVIPPTRDLPPPEPHDAAIKNPAWPKDPDVQRARQAKIDRKKPRKTIEEESLPETPAQLNRPGPAIARTTQRPTTPDNRDPTLPSSNSELNVKSIFNLDALMGRNKEEYGTFVSEPPRASLIEPPPGYRTPSPAQPYGVGKKKWDATINPMDTPQMRGTE